MPKNLAEPNFIARDPAQVTADIVALYEAVTGKTLYPAQPERIWADVASYRETLVRIGIQEAAKLNLVRYAKGVILDHIAEDRGVTRLSPAPAECTLQFTLNLDPVEELDPDTGEVLSSQPGTLSYDCYIPQGTRVSSGDGAAVFASTAEAVILSGETGVTVLAQAQTSGESGNGYQAGSLTSLLDPVDYLSVTNTDATSGGADSESDSRFRARLIESLEGFSTCGPGGAYRFHAMSASAAIIDAASESPYPGLVLVYCLTRDGTLSSELIAEVLAVLSAANKRPLTDQVMVRAPQALNYAVSARYWIYPRAVAASVASAIQAALEAYAAQLALRLGRDVIPSQITAAIQRIPGVARVELDSPGYVSCGPGQYPKCTSISLNLAGVADEL